MKITKTKEVVTEDIELLPGVYYYEDEDVVSHKFTLKESEEGYQGFILETLHFFSNKLGIIIREDGAWDEEGLPYSFKQFILGISGKKIEKEEYYKERTEIIEKLKNE